MSQSVLRRLIRTMRNVTSTLTGLEEWGAGEVLGGGVALDDGV